MPAIRLRHAFLILILMAVLVFLGFGLLGLPLHLPILFQLIITSFLAVLWGKNWFEVEEMILKGLQKSGPIVLILMLIGALIGVWMYMGTIPSMVFYGLDLISPRFFYLISFLLCSLVSLAMGTGFGTISTMGLALFSIGSSLGLPLPVVAGAIVSGSYFGDRFSPVSSIAIFTAHTAGISIRDLLGKMVGTTIPALGFSVFIYFWLGRGLAGGTAYPGPAGKELLDFVAENFPVSPLALLPPLFIIGAAFFRLPTLPNLAAGLFISLGTGLILNPGEFIGLLGSIYDGLLLETGQPHLDQLFSRGGIIDLLDLLALIMLASCLAGVLEGLGVFSLILKSMMQKMRKLGGLVFYTAISGILVAMVGCNQLLAVLLPGRTFYPLYRDREELALLGRTLADTGLVFSPLIPWNINALLVVSVLGVDVLTYFPFAVMNWLLPLITILAPLLQKRETLNK